MSEQSSRITSAPATPIIKAAPSPGNMPGIYAEDLKTPTQSRTVSPRLEGNMPLKNALPFNTNSHIGLGLVTNAISHDTSLLLQPPRHVHDCLAEGKKFPQSHSLTQNSIAETGTVPSSRVASLDISIGPGSEDMPESFPRSTRPSSTRRQHHSLPTQVQQQSRHIHGQSTPQPQLQQPFHPLPSPLADSGYHYSPSLSGSSVHNSYGHTPPQPQPITQHPPNFVGHYAQPPPSVYAAQPQFPYVHPPPHGMPPLPRSDFYQVSPTQPPMYPHPSVPPERSSTSTLAYDFDGGSVGRSPTSGANSPYTPSPPFPSFGYHSTLPSAPQYPPYSTYQPQHQHLQRTQYTHSYTYMTTHSPTTPEDNSSTAARWWYIPPHSTPSSMARYPVYYVDAYGNRPNPGPGVGQAVVSPPSVSPMRVSQSPSFPSRESSMGLGSRTVSADGADSVQSPTSSRSQRAETSISEQVLPSSFNLGESVSERGQQAGSTKQSSESQLQRRANPNIQRSEWVMWIGNVPGDATHDELWRFFTRPGNMSASSPTDTRSQFPPSLLPSGLLSPSASSSTSEAGSPDTSGVQSVFLIARSNCAFVNYSSAEHLHQAVNRFNGVQLRPGDPRCPRLVCRVRGKEEDMRAGVGGQRGMGMHTRWVKEQRERELELRKRLSGSEASLETPQSPSEASIDTQESVYSGQAESARSPPQHSSSSGSTSSSFLARHFPKRYFILKSLSQHDLDISVQKGIWATQPHNETVLNQAYRTSRDVYLIFGVNKSGEFFGYARMAGPIGKSVGSDERVSWASRSDSYHTHSPAVSLSSSAAGRGSQLSGSIREEDEVEGNLDDEGKDKPPLLFSPSEHRLAEASPQPITDQEQKNLDLQIPDTDNGELSTGVKEGSNEQPNTAPPSDRNTKRQKPRWMQRTGPVSAPPAIGPHHSPLANPLAEHSHPANAENVASQLKEADVELDREAPLRAVRDQQIRGPSEEQAVEDEDRIKRKDTLVISKLSKSPALPSSIHSEPTSILQDKSAMLDSDPVDNPKDTIQGQETEQGQWGSPFKIQWIRVEKLPFHRTRHLRNPWNHEREVKVSRDGTELEPTVGQQLLDEWDKVETSASASQPPGGQRTSVSVVGGGNSGPSSGRRQSRRSHQASNTGETSSPSTPFTTHQNQPSR